jgi:hypothetical protein
LSDDAASLRQAKAAELEALAHRTGDPAFARAARELRAPRSGAAGRPGRRAIDDRRALGMVAGFLEQGVAKSLNEAADLVAHLTAQPGSVDATRARLFRKYRSRIKSKDLRRMRCYEQGETEAPQWRKADHAERKTG